MSKMSGMTAGELIDHLSKLDPKTPVALAYPSGDYWRTTVAVGVSEGSETRLRWSEYHGKHKVLDEDEEGGDDNGNGVLAAVLS